MFGFGSSHKPIQKDKLDEVMARHYANLAADRKAPAPRSSLPPQTLVKKTRFGKRGG